MFFLLPSYCQILSIFTFILSFWKNKYQIHFYITFNMDNSKQSIQEKNFSMNGFLNEREVLSCLFGKSNFFKYFPTCQTRSNDFWIMNAMCTFVYLFVVYFSFAPVISASIYRYVNYFDIHVLMMVTETETLTSTLHHNIFIYLDYVFSATFILSDFIHIYFHIYIYIYIYYLSFFVVINIHVRINWFD